MNQPLSILLLSDGKPGHENQSRGLAEAIGLLTPVQTSVLTVPRRGMLASLLHPESLPPGAEKPALIIGAGHGVHGSMLRLARSTGSTSIVLMKPTLPSSLFDLCILPRHDLGKKPPEPNMIATRGALNLVTPPGSQARHSGLILIGGPSSAYEWDSQAIAETVRCITEAHSDRPWRATNSRRSPADQLDALKTACPALTLFPHQDTHRDWLPQQLAEAVDVWVSEDSVSMIYEALSSGAHVGLMPAPCLKPHGRVARGIDELVAEGYLTRFADWDKSSPLAAPPEILNEAQRCARIVVKRYFPDRLPSS